MNQNKLPSKNRTLKLHPDYTWKECIEITFPELTLEEKEEMLNRFKKSNHLIDRAESFFPKEIHQKT